MIPSRNSSASRQYKARNASARLHAQPTPGAHASGRPYSRQCSIQGRSHRSPPCGRSAATFWSCRARLRSPRAVPCRRRRPHRPHVRIGPELDIPQHRDHIALDRTVDVSVAEDRDGAAAHRSGDAGITEDRHHFPTSPSLLEEPRIDTTESACCPRGKSESRPMLTRLWWWR